LFRKNPLFSFEEQLNLHECSPFWVGIFTSLKKITTICTVHRRHAHSDWQIMNHFFMLYEGLTVRKHGHILLPLVFNGNQISNIVIMYSQRAI